MVILEFSFRKRSLRIIMFVPCGLLPHDTDNLMQHVRLFATQYLAKLTRESPIAEDWQIRLILTQLYDSVPKVCECAVQVLEKICESTETLETVVEMRPSLDHLGDMGAVLFTRSALPSF